MRLVLSSLASLVVAASVAAAEPSSTPKPIPETRVEMKRSLEALKGRTPRLPLPALTAEDAASGRMVVHNGRMRAAYLPPSWYAADFKPDPAMTLDDRFKVRLFWIVSRANNCHYCLGHQEHKLLAAGDDEETIAALDGDWSEFPADQRAAMAFTRKLTLTPHLVTDADLESLRPHFTGPQLVELIYTVSFFNSVNRWTDSTGIPQDQKFRDHPLVLVTPTSERSAKRRSWMTGFVPVDRPALEAPAEVEARFAEAQGRQPLVAIPEEAEARAALGDAWPSDEPIPAWARVLSIFPSTGVSQVRCLRAVHTEGRLPGLTKARLAWVTARENRAAYAAADARRRLLALGQSDSDVFALDGDAAGLSEGDREAIAFARKLTVAPQQITDADVARLRHHFSDHEVAETIYAVGAANMFDRFTESLRLPVE